MHITLEIEQGLGELLEEEYEFLDELGRPIGKRSFKAYNSGGRRL